MHSKTCIVPHIVSINNVQQRHCFLKISHCSSFVFVNSETAGDLNYFINGLKYFAQILIEDGIEDMEIEEGIQPFWTASGLINFVTSAEDLFWSADLTRQDYATLVNAVFARQSLIKALYHVFKNRRFLFKNVLDEHHAM